MPGRRYGLYIGWILFAGRFQATAKRFKIEF
jgi:hypothetical protein